ncbi:MAG: 3-hydroxybutyryl-CoA dehydrogenase [Propionibacteriales bacterium]|nr:3-hydroxybutyryl-CoA dehydrogenase [Propionibacteriales bacterium]
MGAGIAHAFLGLGSVVRIVDADDAATAAAHRRVRDLVQSSADRGALESPVEELTARLDSTTSYDGLAECDLVVEAVPEDLELKHRVLDRLGRSARPDAVLASNTSSFSITALGERVGGRHRFLGLHFFNPVPSSDLVEVVVGRETDPGIVELAQTWVEALGKAAVTVADSPGFATSRLGLALGLEAIRMVEEGVAPAQDIDTAMELGYKHPVGPLRLTDIVGLDVRLGVADYLTEQLGERFRPPQLLRDKVAAGELGRKTGNGFHDW